MRTMCLTTSILALTAGAALAQESTTDQSLQQQVEQVPGSETVGAGAVLVPSP